MILIALLMAFMPLTNATPAIELRQYLLGTLANVDERVPLDAHNELLLSVGADLAYHGDQGVQLEENGLALGAGAALRHGLGLYFVGARLDLLWMTMNWSARDQSSGTSRFLILQPTAEFGRHYGRFTPLIAVGGEINSFTSGRPTGQGFIGLVGLSFDL